MGPLVRGSPGGIDAPSLPGYTYRCPKSEEPGQKVCGIRVRLWQIPPAGSSLLQRRLDKEVGGEALRPGQEASGTGPAHKSTRGAGAGGAQGLAPVWRSGPAPGRSQLEGASPLSSQRPRGLVTTHFLSKCE